MKSLPLKSVLFLLFVVLFAQCDTTTTNPFISIEDGKFMLEGRPYYYLGTNFWHGAYLAANLVEGDRERLLRELDLLAENRITNLRIMAATEESELQMSVTPAFQISPGEYNEELLAGLDFLLAEMGKRNMKAVLVLNNYWQWSGGMFQYINWETGEEIIDPDKTGDWHGFMIRSAHFYGMEKANEMYRDYIKMIVNRKNTVTGMLYKDDPAIMSWQLANEPRPCPDANQDTVLAKQYIDWIHNSAAFIQELDENHLVSTGNEGLFGSLQIEELYLKAHDVPQVDYLTFHIWPKNWSWYDALNPEETFDRAVSNTMDYFKLHIDYAEAMNKPIVLEEFGLERDSGSFSPEAPTTYRDKYLDLIFKTVVESAKEGTPMAGLNFWAWGGEGKAMHEDYYWQEGDSFMGDPPQEAQGLNTVFSTDKSTLEIFSKYNKEIEALLSSKN